MKGRSDDDDEDVCAPPDTNVDVSKNRAAVKITSIFLAFSPEKMETMVEEKSYFLTKLPILRGRKVR